MMNINERTFLTVAMQSYDNPLCFNIDDFNEDLKRFKYIKRLLNRYIKQGELKERLILNHIVILYNVFGDEATRLMFFKLKGYYEFLKPFLVLLNRLPNIVEQVEGKNIKTDVISLNKEIIERLREI